MDQRTKDYIAHRLRQRSISGEGGCILWTGAKSARGHGIMVVTPDGGKTRRIATHRLAYMLAKGELPSNVYVCHQCPNPACFNIEHLYVTHGGYKDGREKMVRREENGESSETAHTETAAEHKEDT